MDILRRRSANFDKAFELIKQSIAVGGNTSLQSGFVAECLPLAELVAGIHAKKFAGGDYAVEIDEAECLSAAMEGLRQIAVKKTLRDDCTPHKLRNLCITAMNCRIIDMERTKLGRHTRKIRPISLNRIITEGDSKSISPQDNLADRMDFSAETASVIECLLTKLEVILGEEQFAIMKAVIQMRPHGYTAYDIAKSLGKSERTVISAMHKARTKLNEYFPEVETDLREALAGSITMGQRDGYKSFRSQ